ncbi:MAG TPA: class II fumarate hydratase [Candidatus Limnocylindrales bacterium]|nr:class II fumarate hydratase [Candidatus Limnocylindrales bacterium]
MTEANTTPRPATRIERDSMGEMEVPADALWGASTQRAVLNFPISGQRMPRRIVRALGLIKRAAAEVNGELGLLDPAVAAAIAEAAQEVADGRWDDHFPVDVYQTGSGTSTNMNANEVIARLAAARVGRRVHPNDDVNRCQSSNDVFPTALQLAGALAIEEELRPGLERLGAALGAKADEFWPIVKTGRTHLQDATPIRLGQEFRGYAGQVEASLRRVAAALEELLAVPLGGTAVGTGINAHPEFAARACARLADLTGLPVRETTNHFWAQASLDAVIAAHAGVRSAALSVWKIASDIRLMGMGPRAGLAELALPETQPGSSIMPGKVNPVIVESTTMVVARVVGNDATIAFAQTGSLLELNVMLPVAGVALVESIELLGRAARNLAERCVEGLRATERGPALVEQGLMLATALAPEIGYDAAAELAKEAYRTGRTIRELALERGLAPERLDELLDPARMTEPGLGSGPVAG